MGAKELLWVIFTTVFSNDKSRGTVPIMNLKEVIVAIDAVLQMKERESNAQNLVWISVDLPGAADHVVIVLMTWVVGVTEGSSRASQGTSTLLLLGLAEWAGPLRCANTCESINAISAASSILTRVTQAFINILVTV